MKTVASILALLSCLAFGSAAFADNVGRDAGKHFQRGVDLYNEGDFRGALVEFKRAYGLLPRANVLYDIGETEYQLQEYATALVTMRRYLSETGASAPHRAEVEATVEQLRGRVGKIALVTDVAHCEVSLDDQPAGVTPLAEPVLVSVGARKLVLTCPDRPVATRRVEVPAGEMVRVDVLLGPSLTSSPRASLAPAKVSVESVQRRNKMLLALSWTSTAVLAAATIAVGTTALVESSQLSTLRGTYPLQSSAQLDNKASVTRGLSIAADTLVVAALVAAGVSTYVTVKYHKERKLVLAFGVGLTSGSIRGSF